MPELLRIIARLNVGGPARHVLRIDAPLARRGWRTLLVTGRPEDGEGDLVDEARAAGLELLVLPSLSRAPSPTRDLFALLELRRLVARRRPALVHTHTAKAGVLGRLAARGARPAPRLVHTFHGHVLSGYFGRGASAAAAGLERRLARRTDALVAVCEAVRDELLHDHGVGRPGQYVVVPPGIDPERAAPDPAGGAALRAELGVPPGGVLLACVGRLAPVKRVGAVLEAFAAVSATRPGVRLLVQGDGPDGAAVRARIATLPGATWRPPEHRLGALYAAADAVVLASRAEGLPQVLVEALSAGVPALATAVGGVPGLLHDGVDGLLVPPDAPTELAGAMARLVDDGPLRARLSAAARARDLSEHGAGRVAERLAALYDDLVAERRLARAGPVSETARPCTSSS